MFDIKAKVRKSNIQPVGTQLKVATPITDRMTDVKQVQPSPQVPMTKGGKKLNVSVVRDYHKESAKRPSLTIPQFTDEITVPLYHPKNPRSVQRFPEFGKR